MSRIPGWVVGGLRRVPALDRAARELAWRAGRRPAPLIDSPGPRGTREEVLAAYARLPIDQVVAFALSARSADARAVLQHAAEHSPDPVGARLSLAAVLLQQLARPDDEATAAELYESVEATSGLDAFDKIAVAHYANALITQDRPEEAGRVLDAWTGRTLALECARADLMNPFAADHGAEPTAGWLEAFNRVFTRSGGDPATVAAASAGATPFDRLRGAPADAVHGELVTVIMSCYRPGPEILTAVGSLIAQSYRDLEIIVTDDASPAEFDGVLNAVAALDPRVRVLRNAENAGTYVRRNLAIDLAAGEYVTVHDSDDWAHPRRIELQMAWLVEHPDAPGSVSRCVRTTPGLKFHQFRGTGLRICEPAILFRKTPVLSRVGYFDTVRKSADGEFRRRVNRVFDEPVHVHTELPPLTLQRLEETSLSGSEIRPHWISEARTVYASNYNSWHARITAGEASPVLDPAGPRPFAAPTPISGVPPEPARYDALYLVDGILRAEDGRDFTPVVDDIRRRTARGEAVGLLHRWSLGPHQDAEQRFHPQLQALMEEGVLAQVLATDPATAAVGIVPEPSALQFDVVTVSTVRFDRLVALTDGSAPHHPGGGAYLVEDCARTALDSYEARLEWASGFDAA